MCIKQAVSVIQSLPTLRRIHNPLCFTAFDQSLGWKCPFLSKAIFAYSLHWTSLHKCCELVRRCFVSLSADWDGKKSITKTCIMSSKWCLSGNIMHYGFALLVMVQGCSGGGISTRVTLSNGIIFKIFITDLVALIYVDGFLRWLVFLVYLTVTVRSAFGQPAALVWNCGWMLTCICLL